MGNKGPTAPKYELLVKKPDGSVIDLGLAMIDGGSAFTTIDKPHAQIHNGASYTGGKVGIDLGVDASLFIGVFNDNPDGKSAHFLMDFSFSTDAVVRILGGVTGRTGGSLANSYNRKTGLSDSGIEVYWGTALDSGASSIKETYSPGGSGPFAAGGELPFASEHIIAAGEWMGFEIENVNGGEMAHYGAYWDFYLAPAG